MRDIFAKKKKFAQVPSEQLRKDLPDGVMTKCPKCKVITPTKEVQKNNKICVKCDYHFQMTAYERIERLLDENSFVEYDKEMISMNPLEFKEYDSKIKGDMEKTGLNEAIVTGEGTLNHYPIAIAVMDTRFRMGSMGSVVGEKIARAVQRAEEKNLPFIIFTASGGARMQEGMLSLMQMSKTSVVLKRFSDNGGLYISIMTNPTTGGVSASFASLGDYNFAEPGALIGFAGKRVIEQTIGEKLPEDFQTSEFLMECGQLDAILHRGKMKETLEVIIGMHCEI